VPDMLETRDIEPHLRQGLRRRTVKRVCYKLVPMARISLIPQKREFFDLYNNAAAKPFRSRALIELLDEFRTAPTTTCATSRSSSTRATDHARPDRPDQPDVRDPVRPRRHVSAPRRASTTSAKRRRHRREDRRLRRAGGGAARLGAGGGRQSRGQESSPRRSAGSRLQGFETAADRAA